jgi:uncharacterized protein with NRDE domain
MCTLLFAWQHHPRWSLIVAGNRDEMRSRATAPAGFWRGTGVFGGRDLQAGGTWMGLSRAGRFAAVTNVREPPSGEGPLQSRGALAAAFLTGALAPEAHARAVVGAENAVGPYNLLVGDRGSLWCASNREGGVQEVSPGVHGLSNAALNTPWPKVRRGRDLLGTWLAGGGDDVDGLFLALADREIPGDDELPDTGFGLVRERMLAPIFIDWSLYGTRSSTVLLVGRDGGVHYEERRFEAHAREVGRTICRWRLDPG